ncbi:TraR/DksA family transcriptional regulator [Planctomicrobium sp. SH661]|uniref:TraR/DksA family transcriptional regulator n=1 Tax=Planctomicrobium sp. SH661 TaxID=3448124 RepID=UPI003F5C3EDD
MARKDALLRLHERLIAQREELQRKLSRTESNVSDDTGGDSGDMAFHDVEKELESQLVSLESRELTRIDKAIEAIRNGTYGLCELCETRIPIARLQALPHTACCVACQRKFENRRSAGGDEPNWESAWEFQARNADRELTMRDLHMETD